MTIYPEEVKTTFWDDLASEFSGTRCLGVPKSESKTYLRYSSGDLLTRRAIETVPGHGFDISLNPQDHSGGLRQLYPVNLGWDRRGRRQA